MILKKSRNNIHVKVMLFARSIARWKCSRTVVGLRGGVVGERVRPPGRWCKRSRSPPPHEPIVVIVYSSNKILDANVAAAERERFKVSEQRRQRRKRTKIVRSAPRVNAASAVHDAPPPPPFGGVWVRASRYVGGRVFGAARRTGSGGSRRRRRRCRRRRDRERCVRAHNNAATISRDKNLTLS